MYVIGLLCLKWTNTDTTDMLLPGYYDVTLVGAAGGSLDGNILGGPGAKFTGILRIKEDTSIRIVAGSSPGTWIGIGKHPPGKFGEGGWSGGANSAAGGGYSALFIHNEPIVMVGGGGGALNKKMGLSAGGFKLGRSYLLQDGQEKYKEGKPKSHRGGNGYEKPLSSGGGGGYFGGDVIKGSNGLGGSSFANDSYFTKYTLNDGNEVWLNRWYNAGDGQIIITNITICNRNCLSCNVQNKDICSTCRPGKPYYNRRCLNSCDELDFPTFEDSDHTCKQCMNNCEQCQNATFCLVCKNGFYFDGQKCTNETTLQSQTSLPSQSSKPTQSPRPSPSSSPHPSLSQSSDDIDISIDKGSYKKETKIVPSESNKSNHFPWWIIGVICGAILIVAVLVFIIYKKKKEESSIEMAEEKADETLNTTTTTATVDNPLYLDSANQEADPFHNDFEEDFEASQVFKSHYPDDEINDDE